MKKIGNYKISMVIAFVLAAFLSVSAISTFAYLETRYNILQDNYNYLKTKYESDADQEALTDKYSNLTEKYKNLYEEYTQLGTDYEGVIEIKNQYSNLLIDHLMSLTFSEIRKEYQPYYDPWIDDVNYYEQVSVEYAADLSAHDIGRVYWPDVENNYYEITGNYLSDEAYGKIWDLSNLINISTKDGDVEKVEKILGFTSTFIEYQYDLNDEFLFPIETITYRTGDCDDFSILAAALFEVVDIESAIGFFEDDAEEYLHCMVLVKMNDLGDYGYYYYDDLIDFGLSEGKWIVLEPQADISEQAEENLIEIWNLYVADEIPD